MGLCCPPLLFHSSHLISPFMDKMACLNVLLGASVVAAGPQNRIPVTVMNNSEVPIKLFVCTRIGELLPVKVEEQTPEVGSISESPPPLPTAPKKGPAAVDLDSCKVTASEKQELKHLLDEYRDVFANNDSEVGRTEKNSVSHPCKDSSTCCCKASPNTIFPSFRGQSTDQKHGEAPCY